MRQQSHDETYIKVKGKWVYLYRAVDSHGDTLDFMTKGGLYQNLSINATEIPQLAYACDRTRYASVLQAGLRQPLLQKLTFRNETQIDLGAWMKRISK
jgi:hypothetical protein